MEKHPFIDNSFVDALAKILSSIKLDEPKISVISIAQISELEEQFIEPKPKSEINRIKFGRIVERTAITKNYYPKPTLVDLQLKENDMEERVQFNGLIGTSMILITMRHMFMFSIASKIKGNFDGTIA